MNDEFQLVECPRDAMQGWKKMIPTADKVRYINALLKVGFHTIDFGSFVSPKLIPQMADTAEVVSQLQAGDSRSELLAIVANLRGASEAVRFDHIHYLGFPFSVSPTFQHRNTNSSPEESLARVEEMQSLCNQYGKELVVYLSMGFGNPYGDAYDTAILSGWMQKISELGIRIMSIADTVGMASPATISEVLSAMIPAFPDSVVGVHLHSTPFQLEEKLNAAFEAGCKRFDGAIGGIGGCPMADDELVGNMDTVAMISYLQSKEFYDNLDLDALHHAMKISREIFT
ncbi:MAG TPA: hydroxymethylglutaryl-CoA lyase [Chitinophagaceae bacterium]|nr:hydroxymethylglutaryl-CoA lyase [Chitinophagaceae bacterium]